MTSMNHYTGLTLLKARLDDMPSIARIITSSSEWYRPFVAEKDMDQHDVDEKWQRENFKKREFWLGKNSKGETVGTVSLQFFDQTAYLGYVYLHADHTGKGHGKKLLLHAKQEAIESGMKELILIAHPKAKWAMKAYLRFGFRVIAKEKEKILEYKDGLLGPYYEEGFHLLKYTLEP